MKRILALIALAAGLSAAPVQWAGNGHWYELSQTNANFNTARAAALASTFNSMQGYLVTITSEEENDFVFGLLTGMTWAGGSDAATEGSWIWLDGPEAGTAFSYTNWFAPTGEPNGGVFENYLILGQFKPSSGWNDGNPNAGLRYVIEYSSTAVPEPSTIALSSLALIGGLLMRRRR